MSLFALWGSWLGLYIISRVLAFLVTAGVMLALAWLPGDRQKRFGGLFAHDGRGMFILLGLVMVIALIGVYFVAQWWFTLIDFAPVGVAVFGAVGIAALTWVAKFVKSRDQMVIQIKQSEHDDDDE